MTITPLDIPASTKLLTIPQYNAIRNNIAEILGVGEGEYGYGQPLTSTVLDELTVTTIGNAEYNKLSTDILKARNHQTGAVVRAIKYLSETAIPAVKPDQAYIQSLVTQTNAAQANRLQQPPAPSQATISKLLDPTASGEWSQTSTHTFEMDFGSSENMRFFFNTGGQIQFSASRPSGGSVPKSASTKKNTSWTNLLKSIGTISFGRTKTVSSLKRGGSLKGYASLLDVNSNPTDPVQIYSQNAGDLTSNTYNITAVIPATETLSTILFTIEFKDEQVTSPNNVSGSLISVVKVLRATGTNVSVPLPEIVPDTNEFTLGAPAPSYSVTRNFTTMKEIGETGPGIDFEILGSNLTENVTLYWSVIGSGVTKDDFEDEEGFTIDSITDVAVQIDFTTGTSGPITLRAANDLSLNEGKETFTFVVRSGPSKSYPIVNPETATLLTTITDTSVQAAPPPPDPSVIFRTQTTERFSEGTNALFNIGTLNMKKSTSVRWVAIPVSPGFTAADFASGKDNGQFTIAPGATYPLRIMLKNKDGVEGPEDFTVELWISINGVDTLTDVSDTIAIVDTDVAETIVPPAVSANGITEIKEGGTANVVEFTVSVPKQSYPVNTRLYWKIVQVNNSIIDASDFSSKYVLGGAGIGGTSTDYIVVKAPTVSTNPNTAMLKRYAAANAPTEGPESFKVEFYSAFPTDPTNYVVSSPVVTINEDDNWGIMSTPTRDVLENSSAGIRYTVTTPFGKSSGLKWSIPVTPLITDRDFTAMSGDVTKIDDVSGYFDVYPKEDGFIEGPELFHVDIKDSLNALKISSVGEQITETAVFNITSDATVDENGGAIVFKIVTPYMLTGTVSWSIASVTSGARSVTAADFVEQPGNITITNSGATLTLHPVSDSSTEGTEEFKLVIHSGNTVFTQADPVSISEIVPYSISLLSGATSIAEGATTQIKIVTPWMAAGTPIWWRIEGVQGNIQASDFTVLDSLSVGGTATQRLTGKANTALVTTGGKTTSTASIQVFAKPDSVTEGFLANPGTETFRVSIWDSEAARDADTEPLKTSATFSVTELVPFSIVLPIKNGATQTSMNEGESITLEVYTPYRPKNTPLYWKIVNGGTGGAYFDLVKTGNVLPEFSQMYGITYVDDNNHASIPLTANNDLLDEVTMNFFVELRELPASSDVAYITNQTYLSLTGPYVARTSVPIIIEDTSRTPEPTPDPIPKINALTGPKKIFEGDSAVYTFTSENVSTTTDLYWTVYSTSMYEDEITEGFSSATPFHVDSAGNGSITLHSASSNRTGTRAFIVQVRLTSILGKVEATAAATEVIKTAQYQVKPRKTLITEGDSVIIDVVTPFTAAPTTLTWTIDSTTGLTGADFGLSADYSTVEIVADPISNSGKGSFTLTSISTDKVEGTEKFTISLKTAGGVAISLPNPCPTISVSENVGYNVAANKSFIYEADQNGTGSGTVLFTVTTPAMSATSTTLIYKIVGQGGGRIKFGDFEETKNLAANAPLIGNVVITNNAVTGKWSGSITLTARDDGESEGNVDSFKIELYTSDMTPIDNTSDIVFLREISTYKITLANSANTSVSAGTQVKFNVSVPFTADVNRYWQVIATGTSDAVVADDFVETKAKSKLVGTEKIVNNTITVTLTPNKSAELKSFTIKVGEVSETGAFLDNDSPSVAVTQSQTYSIVGAPATTYAGQNVLFTINHPAITGATAGTTANTLYWQFVELTGGATTADFTGLSTGKGTLTSLNAKGGSKELTIPLASTISAEAVNRTFKVAISLTETPFTALTGGTSNVITYSGSGSYTLACTPVSMLPNNYITFTLRIPPNQMPAGGSIYWTIADATLNSYFKLWSGNVTVPEHTGKDASIDIVVTSAGTFPPPALTADKPFTLTLKKTNSAGEIITVVNPPSALSAGYSFSPNSGLILSTGTGIVITIKSPKTVTQIYWTAVNQPDGKPIAANWFTAAAVSGSPSDLTTNTYVLPAFIAAKDGFDQKFEISVKESLTGTQVAKSGTFTMPTTPPPDPVASSLLSEIAPALMVVGATSAPSEFVCSISPAVAGTPIDIRWSLSSDTTNAPTLKGIKNGSGTNATSATGGGTLKALTTNSSLVSNPALNTAYAKLTLSLDINVIPGTFTINYTAVGADGKDATASATVAVSKTAITHTYYKDGETTIPPGTTIITVMMSGGGGQGGGMSNAYGGNGSNGDLISGNLVVPTYASKLVYKFRAGGAMYSNTPSAMMGLGGQGGTGIELFFVDKTGTQTHVATVAGGGGGAGGGPLPYPIMFPYSIQPHVETEVLGLPTTSSSSRNTSAGAKASADGAGAGGWPGGASGLGNRSVSQDVYVSNNTSHRIETYAMCATGGSGGVSTIADLLSGLTLTNPSAPETKTISYPKPALTSTDFIKYYGIGYSTGKGNATLFATWELVNLAAGEYILVTAADDSSTVTINNVTYVGATTGKWKSYAINIPAGWNQKIVTTAKQNSNGDGPFYVAASLRLRVAGDMAVGTSNATPPVAAYRPVGGVSPAAVLWSTASPATYVSTVGGGGGGKGGRGVASTSIPSTVPKGSVTAYTGGVNGTPRSSAGELGEPAFIKITIPPALPADFTPSGSEAWTSNGSFTVPSGVTLLTVVVIGAGGGGGAGYDKSSIAGSSGGGGGAGAYMKYDVTVTGGSQITITVGTGGNGGYGNKTFSATEALTRNGSDGTLSKVELVGSFTLTANPGLGGQGMNATPAIGVHPVGGDSGTGSATGPNVKEGTTFVGAKGEPGTTDGQFVDLVTMKKDNNLFYSGGNGANNGSAYGYGGAGGSTNENNTTALNPGMKGSSGYVLISW